MSVAVAEVGVVIFLSLKWNVNGQYWWDILLSRQMLAFIKHQQREYELQVDKIKEIKQRLVEVWKSSNTTFEWKDAILVFPCFVR